MLRPRASPAMHRPSGKRAGGAVGGALPPQPGASFFLPPAAALSGLAQPAPAPAPGRTQTLATSLPGPLPRSGDSAAGAGAASRGKQGRASRRAGHRLARSGHSGRRRPRGSRFPAPRARPPRHRKCRRLGSPHIQFKLSPPPPPLPPGPPPPRPGPAVAPTPPPFAAAPVSPQGVPPAGCRGRRAPPRLERRPESRRPKAETHPWCCC